MPQDKLAKPAFAGESQIDRAARAALHTKPIPCTCLHILGNQESHDIDCPRFVPLKQPSDDLPF